MSEGTGINIEGDMDDNQIDKLKKILSEALNIPEEDIEIFKLRVDLDYDSELENQPDAEYIEADEEDDLMTEHMMGNIEKAQADFFYNQMLDIFEFSNEKTIRDYIDAGLQRIKKRDKKIQSLIPLIKLTEKMNSLAQKIILEKLAELKRSELPENPQIS